LVTLPSEAAAKRGKVGWARYLNHTKPTGDRAFSTAPACFPASYGQRYAPSSRSLLRAPSCAQRLFAPRNPSHPPDSSFPLTHFVHARSIPKDLHKASSHAWYGARKERAEQEKLRCQRCEELSARFVYQSKLNAQAAPPAVGWVPYS